MYHNVFRATAVLLLSYLSAFSIVVSALNGYIEPGRNGEAVVEQGTDLHLNCTLSNVTPPGSQTAVDIVWYRGSQRLPTDWYSAVSDSVSQLALTNVTFDQSSSYSCGFQEDAISKRIWVTVLVGRKPEPAQLECIIRNPDEYRCSWEETTNTNLRTAHLFQFRPFSNGDWRGCPPHPTCHACEENTCFVGISDNTGGRQEVRVKTTNALGEAVTTQSFDPYNDVVVNPPRDVVVTRLETETSLKITWFLPEEWHRITNLLDYKLSYKEAGCQSQSNPLCHGEQVVAIGRTNSLEYLLRGLDPYTEYAIRLAARFGLDEKNWSEWTPEEAVYTRQLPPSETVGNLTVWEEFILSDPYLRDVVLLWEKLPVQNRRGFILGYHIEAVQMEGTENGAVLKWNSTSTWFRVQRLQRYFPYRIKVAAFNQAGAGPWASVPIDDQTTAPAALEWVQAAALTTTSINVTWGAPSKPNGIILNYIVQWRKSGEEKWQSYATRNATTRHHLLEHLDTYVLYEVAVKARNSGGDGEATLAHSGGRTLPGVPDAAPSGLTVKPINSYPDRLTLAWDPLPIANINGDLQGYLIGYCKSESSCTGKFLQHKNLSSPDYTTATIKDLAPSTQYFVWLAAYTSVGQGPDSDVVLAITKNEASVVIVPAVVGPLLVGLLFVVVIVCFIRQVINSQSIPDPKIARDVDVMKMNGGMHHRQIEQEIFDNIFSDSSPTGQTHPLESVIIEDLKKQTFKFSRSESNDSGFPPSPARSSANLDYVRDKLSSGDIDDSVFEEEHGRMKKDMHKKSSGLTSRPSQSDSVGPYTTVGELPFSKIPPSPGLGPPSVKDPSGVMNSLKGSTPTDSSCRKGSPSSPSVDVSPYTQMSTLFGSRPAKVNQNRNKLPTVGSNENQITQIKEVSPYTLMSAMSSVPHRQPKPCQEPSVGASKCTKQTHHLGSAPTLSVPSQMLAMEAIQQKTAAGCHNRKSPPESPSTVSPYCKLEDLNLPRFSANSSSNPMTNSTQPVSPYIQMPEVNFLIPRKPPTNETQQVSPTTTTDIQNHKPLPVLPQPVSPYIQAPEVKPVQPKHSTIPPSCAVEKPSSLKTNPAALQTLISDTAASQPLDPQTEQANQHKELPSGISPNASPSVVQKPVSPYTQAPGVTVLQLIQAQTDQPKQHPPSVNEDHPPTPNTLQQFAFPYIQTPTMERTQQQPDHQRELPPDTDSNKTPPASSDPVTPYITLPKKNSLQLSKQQTNDEAKQDPSCNTGGQLAQQQTVPIQPGQLAQQQTVPIQPKLETPQPSKQDIMQQQVSPYTTSSNTPVLSQSALPYTQMPETKMVQPNECHVKKTEALPPASSSGGKTDNPALVSPQTVSPYMKIPETKTHQLAQRQAEQLHKEANGEVSTQTPFPPLSQTVSEQRGSPYVQVPEMKSMQLSEQQATQPKDPQPVSHIIPIPEKKTMEQPRQQSPHLLLLHEVNDTESPTHIPAPVSPQAVSPYIQIQEINTPHSDRKPTNQPQQLSSEHSEKNQNQDPLPMSSPSLSTFIQNPESKTLGLPQQQANQPREPQPVSQQPGSSYVQCPKTETPQLTNQSEVLASSSENRARSPQSVPPEHLFQCVQSPEHKTEQLGPQEANHSEDLYSSSGYSENQAQNPQSVWPQTISTESVSPYVQMPATETPTSR